MEVRGEKTKDGIRFKCKDVARVFEMDSINHNIQKILDSSEYDIFCSGDPTQLVGSPEQNMGVYQASTYLTYNGLLKIIFASRSGTAYRFQDWATNIIYTAHLGRIDERLDVAASVIDTDVESMRMYFEEQLRLKEEQYQQREEQYQQRENQYQQQLDEQQDYISILKDISVSDNQRNCTEIIYIATCDSYARPEMDKAGGW